MGSNPVVVPALRAGFMGSRNTRDGDIYGGGCSNVNWNNRPRYGYGQRINNGRYDIQQQWRGREEGGSERTYLRTDIEKKRVDLTEIPEPKNEERFEMIVKVWDVRSTEQGHNFRERVRIGQ